MFDLDKGGVKTSESSPCCFGKYWPHERKAWVEILASDVAERIWKIAHLVTFFYFFKEPFYMAQFNKEKYSR